MATFIASPYAPRKEWLSRMMKQPGSLSFKTEIAAEDKGNLNAALWCKSGV